MVLEKNLENPLDCKEVQPVSAKGKISPEISLEGHAEAEAPVLWPPYVKSQLLRKDPDSWKD